MTPPDPSVGFLQTAARRVGLKKIDEFEAETVRRAEELARHPDFRQLLESKRERRIADERRKPLAAYRVEELSQMSRSFFGPNPAYHEARHRFVHKGVPAAALQGEKHATM